MYKQGALYSYVMKETLDYGVCLYHSANALARVMTKMADEAFAPTGLTTSHAFLLMTVNVTPGIQPTEISETMHLTPSTITRLMEKLEPKGLVERKSSGKITKVYPTAAGMELSGLVKECWLKLSASYAKTLGESDSADFTSSVYEAFQRLKRD